MHKDALYFMALGILKGPSDAEDAVQEAFIKAYVHIDSYQDRFRFSTWIAAILNNVCLSTLRARDWHVATMSDEVMSAVRSTDYLAQPERAALIKSRDELLNMAVSALPEKYASILLMRYWSDLSYQEVADATQQSLGAVKTQLRRAKHMLKESLEPGRADLIVDPA